MRIVEFYKVQVLPAECRPDTFYFVPAGDYTNSYLTDKHGTPKKVGNVEMIVQILSSSGYTELAQQYADFANQRASDADISAGLAQGAVNTITNAATQAAASANTASQKATIASNAADVATTKADETEGYRTETLGYRDATVLAIGNLDEAIQEGAQVAADLAQYTPIEAVVVPYDTGSIIDIDSLKALLQ